MNTETLKKLKKEYDFVSYPAFDGSRRVMKGKLMGIVDKKGKLIVPVEWDYVLDPDFNGSRRVEKRGVWSTVDKRGKIILPL